MSSVGLDVGGTYLKAARLLPDGTTGPVVRRPMPAFLDTAGASREVDPAALIAQAREVLRPLLAEGPTDAVLVTGQMAGIAFVDADGRAVAPIVTWQDTRGTEVDRVAQQLGTAAIDALGDGLRVGLPLVALASLGVPSGGHLTSLLAFVAGSLASTRSAVVHVTDAAAWGMYDVQAGRWSSAALEFLGVGESSLPRVADGLEPVGSVSGVPVLCAVGDQQAALLGAGLDSGSVSVNLATGCQVSVVSTSRRSPAQLRPFFDGRFLHTVTHLPAGRLLTAAVIDCRGSATEADWQWAVEAVGSEPRITAAVDAIVAGIAGAVDRLEVTGHPVLFSGGLVQQFAPIRERVVASLGVSGTVFPGDDAALAGLARLSQGSIR